ncbi:MAG: HIT domain-containing protein [Roseobacter sp.]
MGYTYDDQNIFAKILRGEIPNSTVLETEHSLAFRDLYPQAPTHVLVIPKGPYVSYDHFAAEASDDEITDYTRAVGKVCQMEGVDIVGGDGFRLISNAGENGVQEVPHLHVHILGARYMGRMVEKAKDRAF